MADSKKVDAKAWEMPKVDEMYKFLLNWLWPPKTEDAKEEDENRNLLVAAPRRAFKTTTLVAIADGFLRHPKKTQVVVFVGGQRACLGFADKMIKMGNLKCTWNAILSAYICETGFCECYIAEIRQISTMVHLRGSSFDCILFDDTFRVADAGLLQPIRQLLLNPTGKFLGIGTPNDGVQVDLGVADDRIDSAEHYAKEAKIRLSYVGFVPSKAPEAPPVAPEPPRVEPLVSSLASSLVHM